MADPWNPWTDDLAALGERTASQLRSIAATRATVLSRQEPKMNLFKRRPLFATLVTAAVLALAAPVAWAVGSRIFVSIDPDKSAPDIEHDVQQQLQSAGVPATVHADKSDDGVLSVQIQTTDPSVGSNLAIAVPGSGGSDTVMQSQIRIEVSAQLDDAQLAQLQAVVSSSAVTVAGPDHVVQVLTDTLAAAGFHGVDIQTADDGSITVHVTSAPTTP